MRMWDWDLLLEPPTEDFDPEGYDGLTDTWETDLASQ